MKAVPVDMDLLGEDRGSGCGKLPFAGHAMADTRRILPPKTAPRVLWLDSGVLTGVIAGLIRPPSGVNDCDLTRPPEVASGLGKVIASLYLKYGDQLWRKATHIPVT